MISITKEEKDAILKQYPNTHIVRTMRNQSSRHHYFCEESKPVVQLLTKLRDYSREADA